MAKESQEGELMNPKDARKMMEIMSNNICSRCENCENCRGQIALMRPEMFGTLALAQEQGQIVL